MKIYLDGFCRVHNNITNDEYILLGKAVVQLSKDSESFGNSQRNRQYQHGVLLFSLTKQLPVVVPYSIFEDTYYTTDKEDSLVPVWDLIEDEKIVRIVQHEGSHIFGDWPDQETSYYKKWQKSLMIKAPFINKGEYIATDGTNLKVQLTSESQDITWGMNEPVITYATYEMSDDNKKTYYKVLSTPYKTFFNYRENTDNSTDELIPNFISLDYCAESAPLEVDPVDDSNPCLFYLE